MEEETKTSLTDEELLMRARAWNVFRIYSKECECGRNMKPNTTEKDVTTVMDNVFGTVQWNPLIQKPINNILIYNLLLEDEQRKIYNPNRL